MNYEQIELFKSYSLLQLNIRVLRMNRFPHIYYLPNRITSTYLGEDTRAIEKNASFNIYYILMTTLSFSYHSLINSKKSSRPVCIPP